jgi:hypothetical protein
MQKVQTINYRRFYSLLRQLPRAEKEDLVLQFTGGRTEHPSAMQPLEYFNMVGAMEAMSKDVSGDMSAGFDKARKRLMGCIGGYLRAMGKPEGAANIKAVACRAAGVERFNSIPIDRLNSLYNAFLHRQKDLKTARTFNPDQPVERLEGLMQEAIDGEEYELVEQYHQRITELKK